MLTVWLQLLKLIRKTSFFFSYGPKKEILKIWLFSITIKLFFSQENVFVNGFILSPNDLYILF